MKDQKSIREMCLEDENGYLIDLSGREGLDWFHNIILVAAYNDGYVGY